MSNVFPVPSEELAVLCEQRAMTYGLLGRLYRSEIDEEFYGSLREARYPVGSGNDALDLGYRKIATYLSRATHGVLLELAIDFVRTFIGHRNDTYGAAYPFESVYTSDKRLLMQEARNEVVREYAKAGVVIGDSWTDPEDHIALELEYMQVMADRAARALRAGDEAGAQRCLEDQRAFLDARLRMWVPMLVEDMKRFAKTDFYLGLAYITEGFLEIDSEFFKEAMAD